MRILDPFYYVQGHIRYKLYYQYSFLMRKHIKEQIAMRINMMNKECYSRGTCVKCGCKTTHLQMANKICEGDCYPRFFSKAEWKKLKCKNCFWDDEAKPPVFYYNAGDSEYPVIRQKFEYNI